LGLGPTPTPTPNPTPNPKFDKLNYKKQLNKNLPKKFNIFN